MKFLDKARQEENKWAQAFGLEVTDLDAANDNKEGADFFTQKEARAIQSEVLRETGVDVARAQFRKLAGDTAGLYTFASQSIELDSDVYEGEDNEVKRHVALHEANHAMNDVARRRKGEEQIIDTDFNEGLTELRTSRVTGEIRAYHKEVARIDVIAGAVGETKDRLLSWYAEGENGKLNDLYDQFTSRNVA